MSVIDASHPLRVAFLYEVFAPTMGYAPTCIARELASTGVDMHYVSAGLPPNHHIVDYSKTYNEFLGIRRRADEEGIEGVHHHLLDFKKTYGGVWMKGVEDELARIKPDVVQTFSHVGWAPLQAAWLSSKLGFKVFTANHMTASVFPLARRNLSVLHPRRIFEFMQRAVPGRWISSRSELCFGATKDCSEIAVNFFGVPENKLVTMPLGVDTSVFHPAQSDAERTEAAQLRSELGVEHDEIMAVYTGRFSDDKNPLLLAQSIDKLRAAGEPYRAVFFGDGTQREAIDAFGHTITHKFVDYRKLGTLFRAADVGVWPTQESTSMIDCAACGTPTIVNDTIAAVERVEGNGLFYRLNNVDDLSRKLLDLKDPGKRQQLGAYGASKMETQFSWRSLAAQRRAFYEQSVETND